MRRMSSDPTFPRPVGDPIDPAGATPILPSPTARIAEPHRAGDGSLIDGGYLATQLTATDGISVDGIAPRSLDVTAPQDTAQRASDLSGLASQFAAVARALAAEETVAETLPVSYTHLTLPTILRV